MLHEHTLIQSIQGHTKLNTQDCFGFIVHLVKNIYRSDKQEICMHVRRGISDRHKNNSIDNNDPLAKVNFMVIQDPIHEVCTVKAMVVDIRSVI